MNLLKYAKVLLYILVPILILSVIVSLLYYFNFINIVSSSYLKLIITLLSTLVGGIYIGNKATKKGWLEGIKVGFEVVVLLFLISYLGFDKGISIKTMIYYFLIIASSMLGSMVGINRRKSN